MIPPIQIRIDKCSNPGSWYANRVGQILPVERFEINKDSSQGLDGDVYWCREGGEFNCLNIIRKEDATLIVESLPTPAPVIPAKSSESSLPILDRSEAYWDGPARKAARAKNPKAWRMDSIDTLIKEAYAQIDSLHDDIHDLMKERARFLNDDERACNLFAAMASFTEAEEATKGLDIQELAEKAYNGFGGGLNDAEAAVLGHILELAGYVYQEEDEGSDAK